MRLGLRVPWLTRIPSGVERTILMIVLFATLSRYAPGQYPSSAPGNADQQAPSRSSSELISQAQDHRMRGEYGEAERLYQQVLAIQDFSLERQIAAHKGLALVYQATQRQQQAFQQQTMAMSDEQELMTEAVEHGKVGGSRNLLAYASSFSESLEVLVSMAAQDLTLRGFNTGLGPPVSGVELTIQSETLGWVLLRKGIVLDTMKLGRWWSGHTDTRDAGAVRELRRQLADLELNPPPGLDETQKAKLRKELQDKLDATEEVIALENIVHPETGAPADAPLQAGDLYRFSGEPETERSFRSAALPAHTALVEFLRARAFDFQATAAMPSWRPAHYYAFILSAGGTKSVKMADLGDANAIDAAIKDVRNNILQFSAAYVAGRTGSDYEKQKEAEFRARGKKLCDLVFAPLRPALGAVRLVYIAPDGELNRVSFEALVSERADHKSTYLVDDYRFAYLSSGRDLAAESVSLGHGTVVLANPNYDLGTTRREELVAALRGPDPNQQARGPLANFASDIVANQPWSRLPGSAREAALVGRELRETRYGPVEVYTDDQALEERLLNLQSPRLLHIATHGFFLPDQQFHAQEAAAGRAPGQNAPAMEDPLLRSGILLAGANTLGRQPGAHVGSGWVTSEEIMGMDLHGTELVVLSGCDTGLGDIQTGEGVLGLRRAFLYAGTRSLLASLYSVPDEETMQLMSRFYESLKAGTGKLDSFHDAQLAVRRARLRQTGVAHPFYWASFVLIGDPN